MAGDVHTAHSPDTFYAPSGRDTSEVFARKQRILAEAPLLYEALNAVHDMVLILNEQRQIVMANDAALRLLKATIHDLLQKRPGEVVECIWSQVGPDGCGTGPHCITCGAVDAILESQEKNIHVVRECRIRIAGSTDPGSLDLRVAATPVIVQGDRFIVLAIEDISKPKRLEVLQRVFFHDVLNTAGCISGCAAYLLEKPQSFSETCDLLVQLSDELVEEIKAQRDLLLAESGDLDVQIDIVLTQAILDELRVRYLKNPVAEERRIEIGPSWKGMIWTDRRLLLRVYGNMLKNGLEATARGQRVHS
jgi:nitrogen fixation/metabolism regulation signal transduction histidine kinase